MWIYKCEMWMFINVYKMLIYKYFTQFETISWINVIDKLLAALITP
jgi:hypothetical protein